jgi:DNA-binding SARP family transcriptional activator
MRWEVGRYAPGIWLIDRCGPTVNKCVAVSIRLLGPADVDGHGELRPRDRMVLCALGVKRDEVVRAEQVADAVWGDHPPATWPKQVQIDVHRLRKVLGAGAIETVAGGYRLGVRGDDLDLDRFERLIERGRLLVARGEPDRAAANLAEATALWRGAPFGELERWEPARSEAARLEELHRGVAEELMEARLAAGDHRQVAAEAERLVLEQPLRERRWAILAVAQYRCDRQGDALRTLQRARQVLLEELGVDPGPELVALESAVLVQDEWLRPVAQLAATSDACPYKGLAAYEESDAENFHGRETDVAACLERLRSVSLLVIAGPSGCGKSSLVRAGLLPAVRRGGRAAVVIMPGPDPDATIGDCLARADAGALVIVDQFEELFAVPVRTEMVRAVCERLVAHSRDRGPVVIVVRADHLGGLAAHAGISRLVEKGLYLVGPLGDAALRTAIEQPGARAGLRLEPGLVDLLVRDTEGEPGALPLLSHSLVETWRRREGNVLTVDGYRSTGGIRAAVARSADDLYESLAPDQRAVLRAVMLRLVVPSLDGDPVRCRVALGDLLGDPTRQRVIAALVRARLVTAEEATVELAHEALARAWPRLQVWLDEDAAGQLVLRHLGVAASGWDTLGRPSSELYRGVRLDTAQEWRDDSHPVLTETEQAFLDASVAAAASEHNDVRSRARRDARQNRRLRRAVLGAAVLAVVACVAGSLAWLQSRRAESNARDAVVERTRAEGGQRAAALRALVSDAVALRAHDRGLAALLAVEAYRLAPGPDTEAALFGSFTAAPGIGPTAPIEMGNGSEPFLLPAGDTIALPDDHGAVRLIDVATGHQSTLVAGQPDKVQYTSLAPSSDGRYIALAIDGTGDDDQHNSLTVWDLQSRRRRFEPVELPFRPGSVAISADGGIVAAAGGFLGRSRVFDGATGALLHELEPMARPDDAQFSRNTAAVLFDAHGDLLVSSQAGPIRFFSATTGHETGRIDGPPQTAEFRIAVSPDGRSLLSSGAHGVMLHDLASGAASWPSAVPLDCTGLAFAELIGQILCGVEGGRVAAIDRRTGAVVGGRFDSQTGNAGFLVAPDGRTLLQFTFGKYTQWKLDGGSLVSRVLPVAGHVINYTTDGQALIVADHTTIKIVEVRTGAIRDQLDEATDAKLTSDPNRLVVHYANGTLGWYDLAAHAPVGTPVNPGIDVFDYVVTGDAVLAWPFGGALTAIDLAKKTVTPFGDPQAEVWQAYTAGEQQLVTDSPQADGVSLRDPSSGAVLTRSHLTVPLTIMASGKHVIVVNSPDGQLSALDAASLHEAGGPFPAVRGHLATGALSIDERRLLVLGDDGAVRLYEVASRTQLGDEITLNVSDGAALRGDGLEAAANSEHGIIVWDLDPQHWIDAACVLAGRNLTPTEWSRHLDKLGAFRTTCPAYP